MGKGLDKFKAQVAEEIELVKDNKAKEYWKKVTDKMFAEHIDEVCDSEYDDMLAQEHKSFRRAWKFITNKAHDIASTFANGVTCAMVDDSDVYAWFDEYVGTDDKAEVEAEEKKKAEAKAKAKTTSKATSKAKPKAIVKKVEPEPEPVKEGNGEVVSIFDLMMGV